MTLDPSEPVTVEAVLALPPVFPLWPEAGVTLGMSRDSTYRAVRAGTFPVKVLRRGRLYRVRRVDVLDYLGIRDTRDGAA